MYPLGRSFDCGGVLNSTSDWISPLDSDGDGVYDDNLDCVWYGDGTHVIHGFLSNIDIETGANPFDYDYLEVTHAHAHAHAHTHIGRDRNWVQNADLIAVPHYKNMPMQMYRKFRLQNWKFSDEKLITKTCLFKYIENFTTKKIENFQIKNSDIFHISAQNIDCEYSLEPPRRGGSNEYAQSMFWAEIRKIMYTPVNPSFSI